MTRSRVSLRGSQPGSGESEEESSDARSPEKEKAFGRARRSQEGDADEMDTKA